MGYYNGREGGTDGVLSQTAGRIAGVGCGFKQGRAMVSRYSLIQYVPDPIASERINLAVLVFDEDEIRVRFLENWKRVHSFGPENIEFLKNFAGRMNCAVGDGLFVPDEPNTDLSRSERLLKISQDWQNIIQITPPRKSLGEIDVVLDEIAAIFLKEPLIETKPRLRDA
jgi:hypothetical protein